VRLFQCGNPPFCQRISRQCTWQSPRWSAYEM